MLAYAISKNKSNEEHSLFSIIDSLDFVPLSKVKSGLINMRTANTMGSNNDKEVWKDFGGASIDEFRSESLNADLEASIVSF